MNSFEVQHLTDGNTLSDRVTDVLCQKIRKGHFPLHSLLPSEQLMAESFGVSRTVIREAISRLKSDGLVRTRQGSGTIVLEPNVSTPFRIDIDVQGSKRAVLRVIELRRGLEMEMAALAAERHSEAQLKKIKRALAAIDRAVRAGRDGVEEDLAFHLAIAQATGNPLYPSLLKFLAQFLKAAIRITRSNESRRKDLSARTKKEHHAIAAAIEKRDVATARVTALEHMEYAAARILEADEAFWADNGGLVARKLAETNLNLQLRRAGRQPTRT